MKTENNKTQNAGYSAIMGDHGLLTSHGGYNERKKK